MIAFRTFVALSVATLAAACASPGASKDTPASPGMGNAGAPMTMATMEHRMKAMREMHAKMMNAKTPAERQALVADHMKSMQDGMEMMKGMGGMAGMGGMGPMGGAMGDGKGIPAEMVKRHQMMEGRMEMMQMMMEMMMQRLPNPPSTK